MTFPSLSFHELISPTQHRFLLGPSTASTYHLYVRRSVHSLSLLFRVSTVIAMMNYSHLYLAYLKPDSLIEFSRLVPSIRFNPYVYKHPPSISYSSHLSPLDLVCVQHMFLLLCIAFSFLTTKNIDTCKGRAG